MPQKKKCIMEIRNMGLKKNDAAVCHIMHYSDQESDDKRIYHRVCYSSSVLWYCYNCTRQATPYYCG